jgi:hypothetical protein
MKRVEITSGLQHPRYVVFAVVMSPETAHLIDPAVRSWTASERPIAAGTRFAIRGRLGRVPIRGTSEVAIWDPPRLAGFRSVSPSWPMRMVIRFERVAGLPERVTASAWFSGLSEPTGVLSSGDASQCDRSGGGRPGGSNRSAI